MVSLGGLATTEFFIQPQRITVIYWYSTVVGNIIRRHLVFVQLFEYQLVNSVKFHNKVPNYKRKVDIDFGGYGPYHLILLNNIVFNNGQTWIDFWGQNLKFS